MRGHLVQPLLNYFGHFLLIEACLVWMCYLTGFTAVLYNNTFGKSVKNCVNMLIGSVLRTRTWYSWKCQNVYFKCFDNFVTVINWQLKKLLQREQLKRRLLETSVGFGLCLCLFSKGMLLWKLILLATVEVVQYSVQAHQSFNYECSSGLQGTQLLFIILVLLCSAWMCVTSCPLLLHELIISMWMWGGRRLPGDIWLFMLIFSTAMRHLSVLHVDPGAGWILFCRCGVKGS